MYPVGGQGVILDTCSGVVGGEYIARGCGLCRRHAEVSLVIAGIAPVEVDAQAQAVGSGKGETNAASQFGVGAVAAGGDAAGDVPGSKALVEEQACFGNVTDVAHAVHVWVSALSAATARHQAHTILHIFR